MIRLRSVSGQETSSKSKPSHTEEDAPHEDEYAEAREGGAEVLSNGQVASDGDEGQDHFPIQNTLSGVSHIFGTHEESHAESDKEEKIQSAWQKWCQPSPKEDTPSKESSESSSEEDQPTDEALHDKAQQWAQQPDTNFNTWWRKKIAKGVAGWATRSVTSPSMERHNPIIQTWWAYPWTTCTNAKSLMASDQTSMICASSTSWG